MGQLADDIFEGDERPPDFGHHDAIVVVGEVVGPGEDILGDAGATALEMVTKGASKGYTSWYKIIKKITVSSC